MKKVLMLAMGLLASQAYGANQILEQNLVTLEQPERTSTLVLSSCELETLIEGDEIVKSLIPSGNLFKVTVAGVTYQVESIGLFARQDGQCLLKMQNAIIHADQDS